ncbi:MAG: hypothetical protein K6E30_08995 [Lachnospiraceae bacterium]|nr:hypothetical protein [Lachnospiraceae bacterium]
MAGYRICREKTAIRPFYIECIATSIYTIEELCFFFCEYLPLLDASIMSPALIRWVDAELGANKAAALMEKAYAGGNNFSEFIFPVFDCVGWLDQDEREEYKKRLEHFFSLPAYERLKMKGDALIRLGRYVAASVIYRQLIEEDRRMRYSREFLSGVWHNKGVSEMKMMLYDEAVISFRKAEELHKTPLHTRAILLALGLSKPKAKYDEEVGKMNPDPEVLAEADNLLSFVRGNTVTITLPEDIDAYLKKKVEEYHTATGA